MVVGGLDKKVVGLWVAATVYKSRHRLARMGDVEAGFSESSVPSKRNFYG